ncbi:hypothetical protein [Litorimonas sp. WD9-15]|uniref:hypothetical protein n=1 Tax=Litorimonas sp. WD9-15 TaxID=3418716 RepID=UPI003D052738
MFIDLVFIGIFVQFLHAIFNRWYATSGLFILYVLVILFFGANIGPAELIGFGTTPTVDLTRHAIHPVGWEAAWIWRLYWAGICAVLYCVTLLIHQVRQQEVFSHKSLSTPYQLALILSLIATIFTGYALNSARLKGNTLYTKTDPERTAVDLSLNARATLLSFDLSLVFDNRTLASTGQMVISNMGDTALPVLYLEKAPILNVNTLSATQDKSAAITIGERRITIDLTEPLNPGQSLQLTWNGLIDARNPFDKVARTLIMKNAFFLQTPALIPLPRRATCFDGTSNPDCFQDESYLLTDQTEGKISIKTADNIVIPGSTSRLLDTGQLEHEIIITPDARTNFMITGSQYKQHKVTLENSGSQRFSVYVAPYGRTSAQRVAEHLETDYRDIRESWCPINIDQFWVAETPPKIFEATTFGNGIAVSERFMGRRNQNNSDLSDISRIVLTHELAHLWYGYKLTPERGPGFGLVLESIPQFVSIKKLEKKSETSGTNLVENMGQTVTSLKSRRADLAQLTEIEEADWRAYYEGSLALLSVDQQEPGQLIEALGRVACESQNKGQPRLPNTILDDIFSSLETDLSAMNSIN